MAIVLQRLKRLPLSVYPGANYKAQSVEYWSGKEEGGSSDPDMDNLVVGSHLPSTILDLTWHYLMLEIG